MFGKLFLLFTLLPVAELYVLLQIGERIGGVTTFAMVVLTGLIGAALARAEALRVLRDWRQSVHAGRLPTDGLVSGGLVLLGCTLLISPGVITDVFGVLLLIPFTRNWVARIVSARVKRAIERGTLRVVSAAAPRVDPFGNHGARHSRGDGEVIDVTGAPVDPPPPSVAPLPRRGDES